VARELEDDWQQPMCISSHRLRVHIIDPIDTLSKIFVRSKWFLHKRIGHHHPLHSKSNSGIKLCAA
jgi:hypothetical protein